MRSSIGTTYGSPQVPELRGGDGSGIRFLQACGTPLAASAMPRGLPAGRPRRAERRPLTVLFCDIVGSVSLANTLDPEDMMNVLEVFRKSCDDIIARNDGYVARYIGDGILAYFGYPSADEEDASRAVRAALALQAAMESLPLPNGSRSTWRGWSCRWAAASRN